jgi:hypothetical protein
MMVDERKFLVCAATSDNCEFVGVTASINPPHNISAGRICQTWASVNLDCKRCL